MATGYPALNSRQTQWAIALAGLLAIAVTMICHYLSWRQGLLLIIGAAIGLVLYRSRFGFSSAYRRLLRGEDVSPMLNQLILLAATSIVFVFLFANQMRLGIHLSPALAPIGLAGLLGAFLFGIGMQLSRACGCGSLAAVGGGSVSLIPTLLAFGLGAFVASLLRPIWSTWPALPPQLLADKLGWVSALFLQLWFLLLVASLLWLFGRRPQKLTTQPWPTWVGAVAIALLAALALLVAGEPWRVTWGFALTTAKAVHALGGVLQNSEFWSSRAEQLNANLLADASIITNLGVLVGALLGSLLEERWRPKVGTRSEVLAAVGGGLSMGFGAFLAAGCNISAYLGGIASTSLHGWVWIFAALAGSAVGLWLRPFLLGQQQPSWLRSE
jgi:uncharacterized membrane protein YedE/YeeE